MSPFTIAAVDIGRGQAETKILGIIVGGGECNLVSRRRGVFVVGSRKLLARKSNLCPSEENMNLCPLHKEDRIGHESVQ